VGAEEVRVSGSGEAATTTSGGTKSLGEQRLGIIHSGSRYVFGFGPDFYGIWDEMAPGEKPLERFDTSQEGRGAGWQRYLELDPAAADFVPSWMVPPHVEGPKRRRWIAWAIAAGVVAIAIVAIVVFGGGKKKANVVVVRPQDKEAKLTVTGDLSATGTLTQKSFTAQGIDQGLPLLSGDWTGNGLELKIRLVGPHRGDNLTGGFRQNIVDIILSGANSPTAESFQSNAGAPGDCVIHVASFGSSGMKGNLSCTGIESSAGKTIEVKGTFAISAST